MTESRIDLLIRHSWLTMLLGAGLGVLAMSGGGIGIISAVGLFLFGSCGAALQEWKKEPGLWMLSALLGTISVIFLGMAQYGLLQDALHQRRSATWIAVDGACCLSLLNVQIRLLYAVTLWNWKLTATDNDSAETGSAP